MRSDLDEHAGGSCLVRVQGGGIEEGLDLLGLFGTCMVRLGVVLEECGSARFALRFIRVNGRAGPLSRTHMKRDSPRGHPSLSTVKVPRVS